MPTMNDENTFLHNMMQELSRKLDTLIEALPKTYVTQQDNDRRFQSLERDVQSVKDEMKAIRETHVREKQWANDEHTGLRDAVQEARTAIQTSQQDILNKIDERNHSNLTMKITMLLAGIGWAVTILLFIISYYLH